MTGVFNGLYSVLICSMDRYQTWSKPTWLFVNCWIYKYLRYKEHGIILNLTLARWCCFSPKKMWLELTEDFLKLNWTTTRL